VLGMIRGNLR